MQLWVTTVGHSGEKRPTRRAILDYLVTEQLPMVDNPVYVAEWGDPSSKRRLDKLCRTIERLSGKTKIVKEWSWP